MRLAILNAIADKLETITTANGYLTNVGNRVFYWQDLEFEYGEIGAISYRDPFEENKEVNLSLENSLTVEVSAIQFTENALTDSCNLLTDLIRAIKGAIWANKSIKSRLVSNDKRIETKGKTAIQIKLVFKVTYWEDYAN
jgi:hypothetical protein